MAVITSLKPFESVPHPSVTYFSVKKLPCVMILPTDCFVFRHDTSNCKYMDVFKINWPTLIRNLMMCNTCNFFLPLVHRLHGLHHKYTGDRCNPAVMYRNAPEIAAESNVFEMLVHNLNFVHFATIKQHRPFFDRPFVKNGFYIKFSFDLYVVRSQIPRTGKKERERDTHAQK